MCINTLHEGDNDENNNNNNNNNNKAATGKIRRAHPKINL
jgi:hypothetical protein